MKIFFVLLTFISTFLYPQNEVLQFSPPEWSYNKTIYEVNTRQFSKEGTFKAFEEHLPRLKEMGVGIIWFMPIHPIGVKNRKGTLGSYYSVKDYKAVNSEFGTLDDFKKLVKKIHKLDMYVIIDWVANHTAWDNVWVDDHPEFYTKDSLGNIISPNPDWIDVADLNYNNKDLWDAQIDALKFWIKECDIDGYRCDVAGMLPIDFWIEVRKELEKIKNVFMLAEWDTPEHHKAFEMTYDWNLYEIMNDIANNAKNVTDIKVHFLNDEKDYPENAFRMRFTSNHDENTWNGTVFERLGNGAETFAVLTFLIPGMPLIYNGQETGLHKRLSFFEKDEIEWKESNFTKIYTQLIKLKASNKALLNGNRGGNLILLNSTDEKNIFAFTREQIDDKILAIFNFSDKEINFEVQGESLTGTFRNYFNGEIESFTEKEVFNLKPWQYKVLVK